MFIGCILSFYPSFIPYSLSPCLLCFHPFFLPAHAPSIIHQTFTKSGAMGGTKDILQATLSLVAHDLVTETDGVIIKTIM